MIRAPGTGSVPTTLGVALAVCALAAPTARAQDVRPGDEPLEIPELERAVPDRGLLVVPLPEIPAFEPPERTPGTALPPLEISRRPDTDALEGGLRVHVAEIHVVGNTVFSEEEIRDLVQPFAGRELAAADLDALRDRLTRAYVERGYVSSGAVIPPQSLADGVLEVRAVEGAVDAIRVQTDGRFRGGYVRQRLARYAEAPVDVHELEKGLQILQQDDRIRSVHAALVPGEQPGRSILEVRLVERQPWTLHLEASNLSSPVIGEARGDVAASFTNLTGWGDVLRAEYRRGVGLTEVRGSLEVPLGAYGTRAQAYVRRTWSEVVEDPFDFLDIDSETETYGTELRQSLYRTPRTTLEAFGRAEYRRSETFLFGDPFSFVAGPEDGVAELAIVRVGTDWMHRAPDQVFGASSMVSVGLDLLGATEHGGDEPDGQFVAWLGRLQWVRRLPWLEARLLVRSDLQIADRPLLGLEQFAVGGRYTVRGYRENTLVRDNGFSGSVELRVPVSLPQLDEWGMRFELAPFFDAGYSWNSDRPTLGETTLLSVVVGARWAWGERAGFEVYWGEALTDVEHLGETSLQDRGLHLALWVDFR